MAIVPLATLKGYFAQGKVPNEQQYIDLIDTLSSTIGSGTGGDMQAVDYDPDFDLSVENADYAVNAGTAANAANATAATFATNADKVDNLHAAAFHQVASDILNVNSAKLGGGLIVGNMLVAPGVGNIQFVGNLCSSKGGTPYDVFGYVPISGAFLTDVSGTPKFAGQAHSTTPKTLIGMSSRYGTPGYAKAFDVSVRVRDSASSTLPCGIWLGPRNTAGEGKPVFAGGLRNDFWRDASFIVPATPLGDLYYQVEATGVNTLDIILEVSGYFI